MESKLEEIRRESKEKFEIATRKPKSEFVWRAKTRIEANNGEHKLIGVAIFRKTWDDGKVSYQVVMSKSYKSKITQELVSGTNYKETDMIDHMDKLTQAIEKLAELRKG